MFRETRIIMGMPVTMDVVDHIWPQLAESIFEFFSEIDARFSTYLSCSEVMRYNRGQLLISETSNEFRDVMALVEKTRIESGGYFNAQPEGQIYDPSGIVKGWAIKQATEILRNNGVCNFCIDAGGDLQCAGLDDDGRDWRVGIRSPFHLGEIIKVISPRGRGIATSGSYIRGAHIWNPLAPHELLNDVLSITVIGPDVLEADRFATAAFAMGSDGVHFIESLPGFEAYQVNAQGIATLTTNFGAYLVS